MSNAIHYHNATVKVIAGGHIEELDLIVPYMIYEPAPAVCEMGADIVPAEPLSVEVIKDQIRIKVEYRTDGCETVYIGDKPWAEPMKPACLSPEHIEAIEREILESHES